MSAERPTFSPFWHRVRTLKPRLRPHVGITRQRYRGRIWHVVHDPTSNQFYRLNPVAHDFVGLLDGQRDVESAWKISLSKFGDAAPTQNEVIQLISQLHNGNLLSVDASPETEQLLSRGRERIKQKIQQQAIGIMYFKIRVFNPDRIIAAMEPIFRPIINQWGFFAWAALVAFALWRILPHWEELTSSFETAIAPANWPWLIVVFIVTKAIHEFGHGVICRRFGGQVPEFGLMMLVMFPAPYVDASACWAFPSRWRRMAVGAGGMMFELFVASCAAMVWLHYVETHQFGLPRQLAYNAQLTASISTVLFNANPLMRFDGYYILSDFLEVPNLAQRANNMLKHLIQKYIYRLEDLTPPSQIRSEQGILITYGVLALAYRIFLFVSITLYVMGQMFGIGFALAIWTASVWFVLPAWSFVHWLATGPKLAEHRARHVLASVGMIAAGVILIGVVPFPDHRRAMGVVDSAERTVVYFGAPGFVDEVPEGIVPGAMVHEGDVLARLKNKDLEQDARVTRVQMEDLALQERRALADKKPETAQVARRQVEVMEKRLAQIQEKLAKLVVRAPHDGVIAGADPQNLVGAYMKIGTPLCEVVDGRQIRIESKLSQRDGWIYGYVDQEGGLLEDKLAGLGLEIRRMSQIGQTAAARVTRIILPNATLPHESLSYAGGGQIPTAQDDKSGRRSNSPLPEVWAEPVLGADGAAPVFVDERVSLRFTLPSKPLALQWWDRLSKLMQGRVNM
jgi:putative peptide zinc metalloprotease protein